MIKFLLGVYFVSALSCIYLFISEEIQDTGQLTLSGLLQTLFFSMLPIANTVAVLWYILEGREIVIYKRKKRR